MTTFRNVAVLIAAIVGAWVVILAPLALLWRVIS